MARPKKPPPPTVTTLSAGPARPDADHRQAAAGPRPRPAPRRRPGVAPGRARRRADRRAEARRRHLLAHRSSGPARRRRRSPRRPRLKPKVDRGLLECDFGDWTGAELKKLMKLPGVAHRAARTRRRSASRTARASPRCRRGSSPTLDRLRAGTPAAPSCACRTPTRSRRAIAHALGTHLDLFQRIVISTCSISAIGYRQRRADRADRQLHRRLARRAANRHDAAPFYEFDEVDASPPARSASRAARTFFLQARRARTRVAVKCEKQQVAAIAEYLRQGAARPARRRGPPDRRRRSSSPSRSSRSSCSARSGSATTAPTTGSWSSSRRSCPSTRRARPSRGSNDGHVRLYVTRGQAAAFCDHADRVVAAGRPDCRWCSLPIDPDGHACPRMN